MTDGFFSEPRENSVVKARIIANYFDVWAKIIRGYQRNSGRGDQRIGYVDLFCGPGRYDDGAISTPLRILTQIAADPDYRNSVVTIFNDQDQKKVERLRREIEEIQDIEGLKFPPQVWNKQVGDQLAEFFEKSRTIPLFVFIDPFGYKGLSLRLINSVLKDFGCDCVFFFNYGRVNAGVSNPRVESHMQALFGVDRLEALQEEVQGLTPKQREATVVNALVETMKAEAGDRRFVLPFTFKHARQNRTSHHLVFVTKHFKGYDVMKSIMGKEASCDEDGVVGKFEFIPATSPAQQFLFDFARPITDLPLMLLEHFAGRTLSLPEIYEEHSVGKGFFEKHYRAVLIQMEKDGRIDVQGRSLSKRTGKPIMRGFPPRLRATFPERD